MYVKKNKELKVAVLHYWFINWRGGEKVVRSILDMFPQADIYTLFCEPEIHELHLNGNRVYSSILDKNLLRAMYQKIYPLYPMGVRSLKFREKYDLIISSESGPIKGIANPLNIPHLSYVHTPMRYCWGFTDHYLNSMPQWMRPVGAMGFDYLRRYDETTVDNVDRYVANSQNVRKRVFKYYGREASVVHPPIKLDLFSSENLAQVPFSDREYYLSFGAITPYKNIALLVDAFNRTGKQLVVVGDGSERQRIMAKAKPNIHFTGSLPYADVRKFILGAKALLFPGEEDFGMIPLEVMAHGVPVVALSKGGALETVKYNSTAPEDGTGLFFDENSVESLLEAVDRLESIGEQINPKSIQAHARTFGEDHFQKKFLGEIDNLLENGLNS